MSCDIHLRVISQRSLVVMCSETTLLNYYNISQGQMSQFVPEMWNACPVRADWIFMHRNTFPWLNLRAIIMSNSKSTLIWCHQKILVGKLKIKVIFINFIVSKPASEMLSHCFMRYTFSHWGRVTHICVNKQTIVGSDNVLSPSWC